MESHEIDTFIAMAKRQHEDSPIGPEYWIRVAMVYAYNLGLDRGEQAEKEARERWEMYDDHEDDIPF